MSAPEPLLTETRLLDFNAPVIADLIASRGWADLEEEARAKAAYDFVRDEIAFGYNSGDAIPASAVLTDGYGQCNSKGTLLMALFRALNMRCRLHGFTIHKALQRGIVPKAVYTIAPAENPALLGRGRTRGPLDRLGRVHPRQAVPRQPSERVRGPGQPLRLRRGHRLSARAAHQLERGRHLYPEDRH
ncbi:hypothetical protein GCM10011392_11300 [Wenxinia marina]|nr:hypothetical protein GCM10011392_11300 [Wenxinia marina]